MKTAISIPDEVFKHAERAAKRLGLSRSELYTRALREYLGASRDSAITASYDEAFGVDGDGDDTTAFRREATRKALLRIEWDER